MTVAFLASPAVCFVCFQVPGCGFNLTECSYYVKRHRVCQAHMKAKIVALAGENCRQALRSGANSTISKSICMLQPVLFAVRVIRLQTCLSIMAPPALPLLPMHQVVLLTADRMVGACFCCSTLFFGHLP